MARTIEFTIEIPPESQAKLNKLAKLPDEIPQAVKRGMDRGLAAVRGLIKEQRLSGKGPFPVSEHRLGERSGNLREALIEKPGVISGDTVVGEIRWEHPYGQVHEFGMLIFGKPLMRFQIDGKWIITHRVLIPPRAPIRFGVEENMPLITSEITGEIDKSLDAISK